MLNALDYISWRGDLSFYRSPVNEVDLFLFSQFSTPDYTGIIADDKKGMPLEKAVREYFARHSDEADSLGLLQSKYVIPMLKKAAVSPRYRNVRVCRFVMKYDEEASEQFQAVTLVLPDRQIVVSYRGTDDTIIGWKEDCNLAVSDTIPAQQSALAYLEASAKAFPLYQIYTAGHSKGGNLALYAPAMAGEKVRKRLKAAYSFDGPGFTDGFFGEPGYADVRDRMTTVLSQHAIIGMLLRPAGERRIVKSSVRGPYAHDGFNWEVEGTSFVREEKFSDESLTFEKAMKSTLSKLDTEERKTFIGNLFGAMLSTGAVTLTELKEKDLKTHLELIRRIGGDPSVQGFVKMLFENYVKADR